MKDYDFSEFTSFKVDFAYDNKIMIATFDRPPANAFAQETYEELSKMMDFIAGNEEICVFIFQSTGRFFSAGADVKALAVITPQTTAIRRMVLRKAARDLYSCPVPMISAVHGIAAGAGATFAACADILFASPEATFSLPEINIGVVGGAKAMSRMLPAHKVRAMSLTGLPVSAEEIYRWGGIEQIVPKEELHAVTLEYAKKIADKGALAVRLWKESFVVNESVGAREGLLIEMCFSQELAHFSPKPAIRK